MADHDEYDDDNNNDDWACDSCDGNDYSSEPDSELEEMRSDDCYGTWYRVLCTQTIVDSNAESKVGERLRAWKHHNYFHPDADDEQCRREVRAMPMRELNRLLGHIEDRRQELAAFRIVTSGAAANLALSFTRDRVGTVMTTTNSDAAGKPINDDGWCDFCRRRPGLACPVCACARAVVAWFQVATLVLRVPRELRLIIARLICYTNVPDYGTVGWYLSRYSRSREPHHRIYSVARVLDSPPTSMLLSELDRPQCKCECRGRQEQCSPAIWDRWAGRESPWTRAERRRILDQWRACKSIHLYLAAAPLCRPTGWHHDEDEDDDDDESCSSCGGNH